MVEANSGGAGSGTFALKEPLTLIEGAGHALSTFAAHNKEHLGATASADIFKAGALATETDAIVGELAPQV